MKITKTLTSVANVQNETRI